MDRWYLKLWRRSIDSDVFQNAELWRLFSWCLMKTTYKKRSVAFRTGKGKIPVTLQPGQFIFGRNSASDALGDSPSTIWKRMKKLESLECIRVESNRQYSIVTVCNWSTYQHDETEKEQAGDYQVTGKEQASDYQGTTKELPSDTNKKLKKLKKDKNITTDEYSPRFEEFWKEYPNKKGKYKAHVAWKKYKCDNGQFESIMKSLQAHKKSDGWIKDNGQFIPHGSTWVNGRGWEDEADITEHKPKSRYTPHEIPNV